jgi:hypothetical protein
MVIWKFTLELTDIQKLTITEGAQILSVANQNGNLCLWVMLVPHLRKVKRTIEIIGTGNPIEEGIERKFIGTAVINPFVWHVFERLE